MDFNRLYTFKILAELRSFTETAKALHVTQSAISQQIKLLQEELGFKLVQKVNGLLELTPRGRSFFDTVNGPITVLAEEMKKGKVGKPQAKYRIMGSYNYLSQVFAVQMKTLVPEGLLQFYIGNSVQCIEALTQGKMDLAVLSHPPKSKEIARQVLLEEEMIFVANPQLKISRQGVIPIVSQDPAMMSFAKWARNNAFIAAYQIECFASIESIHGVINFILNMPCAGIVPAYLVAEHIRQKRIKLIYPQAKNFTNRIYLCMLGRQKTPEVIEIFEKVREISSVS
jgi:DNA-binding transcriptional LysR family regulator